MSYESSRLTGLEREIWIIMHRHADETKEDNKHWEARDRHRAKIKALKEVQQELSVEQTPPMFDEDMPCEGQPLTLKGYGALVRKACSEC